VRQRTERALSSLALPHHVQPGASTCTFAIRDLADRASALPRSPGSRRRWRHSTWALQHRPASPHPVRRQRSSPRTPPRGLLGSLLLPRASTVLASRYDQARPSSTTQALRGASSKRHHARYAERWVPCGSHEAPPQAHCEPRSAARRLRRPDVSAPVDATVPFGLQF